MHFLLSRAIIHCIVNTYICLRRCKEVPNIKSAKKRVLVAKVRNDRNKDAKSELKTTIKKARAEGAGADAVKAATVALDKAAGKGYIHKNKAARLKSRLSKNVTA